MRLRDNQERKKTLLAMIVDNTGGEGQLEAAAVLLLDVYFSGWRLGVGD